MVKIKLLTSKINQNNVYRVFFESSFQGDQIVKFKKMFCLKIVSLTFLSFIIAETFLMFPCLLVVGPGGPSLVKPRTLTFNQVPDYFFCDPFSFLSHGLVYSFIKSQTFRSRKMVVLCFPLSSPGVLFCILSWRIKKTLINHLLGYILCIFVVCS